VIGSTAWGTIEFALCAVEGKTDKEIIIAAEPTIIYLEDMIERTALQPPKQAQPKNRKGPGGPPSEVKKKKIPSTPKRITNK
jgi:hypothetical protein